MAFEGQGGPKDLGAAVAAKIKSCDLGDASVCMNLADLWADLRWEGDEIAKDRDGAKRALARACELGEERGCKPPK